MGGCVDFDGARDRISQIVKELRRSQRGRVVADDLYRFLDGPVSGIDSWGWNCVGTLMGAYASGMPGAVLDALQPAKKPVKAARKEGGAR